MEAPLRALVEQPAPPLPRVQARYLQQRIAGRIDQLAAEAAERRTRGARREAAALAAAALAAALTAAAAGVRRAPDARRPARRGAGDALQGSVEIAAGRDSARRRRSASCRSRATRSCGPARARGEGVARDGRHRRGRASDPREVRAGGRRARPREAMPSPASRRRIAVEVPPLPAGMSLSVHTSDAVVTVRTGRASPRRAAARRGAVEPAETARPVVEGRVAVHRGDVERFPSPGETQVVPRCGAPGGAARRGTPGRRAGAAARRPGGRAPARAAGATGPARAAPGSRARLARPPARTSLTAENELLQGAMAARRRGQPRRAPERLDLPRPLPGLAAAEIARVERLRAVEMLGDKDRTAAEARRYLKDYPQGFGREEATSASRPAAPAPERPRAGPSRFLTNPACSRRLRRLSLHRGDHRAGDRVRRPRSMSCLLSNSEDPDAFIRVDRVVLWWGVVARGLRRGLHLIGHRRCRRPHRLRGRLRPVGRRGECAGAELPGSGIVGRRRPHHRGSRSALVRRERLGVLVDGTAQVDCYYTNTNPTTPMAFVERVVEIAASEELVHVRLTLNPAFVDNTYGETAIGWGGGEEPAGPQPGGPQPGGPKPGDGPKPKGHGGHTFKDLVGSDKRPVPADGREGRARARLLRRLHLGRRGEPLGLCVARRARRRGQDAPRRRRRRRRGDHLARPRSQRVRVRRVPRRLPGDGRGLHPQCGDTELGLPR